MESIAAGTVAWTLEQADKAATLAINALHCGVTDFIWKTFSNIPVWIPLYTVILVFFFLRLGWKKALVVTLSCVLTVVCCDQFANLAKDFFQRLRPCWDPFMLENGVRVLEAKGRTVSFGFFSGHAANAFGFAACSSLGFKNATVSKYLRDFPQRGYTLGIFIWAALVGVSRIFVGKHFLGDVLVGTAAGLLIGWLMARLARCIIVRWNL